MNKRRILITGGSGQVGKELLRCRWPSDIELVAPTRQELDLSDCHNIEQYLDANDFSAVVNSGAYTAVDRAEMDVKTAWKVNALAPAIMAAITKTRGIPILHVSTDYVFDGSKDGPYIENDHVSPLGVYGASKEAGEQAIRTGNPRHIILRTAWVFSEHGSNFVKTMLRLRTGNSIVRVVNDQQGSPTSAGAIAETITAMTITLLGERSAPVGTYHFTNEGEATWFAFADEIFKQCEALGYAVPRRECITSDEFPTLARRPKNSALSLAKIGRDFGIVPKHWREPLSDVLAALLSSEVLRKDVQ
ncbi:dTDP-4-dehydrorhamnose reductase [Ensifer sp. NM-2]|uniref:dTDP-4-dehydrorhamnose reductase n=1 Tax=Ensifer sp. NM-2 TaxID=2109730 RepID=UPI000D12E2DC|nr:dTDP-4-dehydrorhamnose reductase [Ensifer sp. NM-2]PSS60319.1 dTDP-4-dehydrorhamnose reductase [Ensifer sp. NM-2]